MDRIDARRDKSTGGSGAGSALLEGLRRFAPPRRRLQFRLRTLLAAVSVLCLLLGFLAEPIVEARREQATADALRRTGADVYTQTVSFPGATLVRPVLGDWVCRRADDVRLFGPNAGRETLRLVAELGHVRLLDLRGAQLSDASLAELRELDKLEHLTLERTNVTDAGLRHLAGLESLTTLSLRETGITDAGLAHLRDLDSLGQLDLRHTRVTDAGLKHLSGLTRLYSLKTFGTQITYAGLARLERELSQDHFREARARAGIAALGGQVETRSASMSRDGEKVFFEVAYRVHLHGARLSGDALAHLPHLVCLEEAELARLTLGEADLAPLADLPLLETLVLRNVKLDEQGLRPLGRLKGLRRLSVHDVEANGGGFEHLARLDRLGSLEFRGTGVSPETVESLRAALPHCEIRVRGGD